MATHINAFSELTKFWLQAKNHCLVYESLPVPVKYNQSDIDLLAIQGKMKPFTLPDGTPIGSRVIIETKDEHDWDASGKEFGTLLDADIQMMQDGSFISRGTKCKFSMLREEHYEVATSFFDSNDFDRLFVLHAINSEVLDRHKDFLASKRIYVTTIADVVADLMIWYKAHGRKAGLRNTLTGDIWHLMVGFCGCVPADKKDMLK
jgi:hypothetical protein